MSEHGPNDALRRWDGESWSLGVVSVFGVRLRFHLSLVLTLAGISIFAFWFQPQGLALAALLFVMLVLHEIGHASIAQAVGVKSEEIVLWPLGSLTAPRIPHRSIESTFIHLGGPAANLLVCLVLLPAIHMLGGLNRDLFNPFTIADAWHGPTAVVSYLALAFKASYWLVLANVCPAFPLDMGRVLREVLAVHTSLLQATIVCVMVGACVGILATGIALWFHLVWVALAGAFVTWFCHQRHRELELLGDVQENEFGYDFSEGYTSLEKSMSHAHIRSNPSFRKRVRVWIEQRKRRKGEQIEVELDRILAKIHDHGMASLSRVERRILSQASRKRRQ